MLSALSLSSAHKKKKNSIFSRKIHPAKKFNRFYFDTQKLFSLRVFWKKKINRNVRRGYYRYIHSYVYIHGNRQKKHYQHTNKYRRVHKTDKIYYINKIFPFLYDFYFIVKNLHSNHFKFYKKKKIQFEILIIRNLKKFFKNVYLPKT